RDQHAQLNRGRRFPLLTAPGPRAGARPLPFFLPDLFGSRSMRLVLRVALTAALASAVLGCSSDGPYDGPKVDAFTGRVTHNGKPVSCPQGEEVSLKVFHEKGQSFGIPLQPDGTFKIGWMLIGKYSVMLNRAPKNARGGPSMYGVPGGLTIEQGKT